MDNEPEGDLDGLLTVRGNGVATMGLLGDVDDPEIDFRLGSP